MPPSGTTGWDLSPQLEQASIAMPGQVSQELAYLVD
jgi:hypothetical protein